MRDWYKVSSMGETAPNEDAMIDRVSNLPADVLLTILTKLPLRDAVRTSILSTKWSHKWCGLPQLVVDSHCIGSKNSQFSKFTTWDKIKTLVYNYLCHHSDAIEKFKLSTSCPWDKYGDLYRLIYFLSKKDVKEFSFGHSKHAPIHDLPDPLFSFQHLTNLELVRCKIELPFELEGLKLLVSLRLRDVFIEDETFARFISGCPAIEMLVLLRVELIQHFRIIGPSLKELKVESKFDSICFEDCANLKSIEMSIFQQNRGGYISSSEYDSLDSASEIDNYDSGSDHSDAESNGLYSGSEVSDSVSNLSDNESENSSYASDNPDSESENYNSETDYSVDESDHSDYDSNDSKQQVRACNLLSSLGGLFNLERISFSTELFKFLAIDDINKRFPIAHKQLVAVDMRDIDFRLPRMVRISLLLLNRFPNLEQFDFSVKHTGDAESASRFVFEHPQSYYLPFEKLRTVKMRYRTVMALAFEYLKDIIDLSPMLETVTIIYDGVHFIPKDLLEKGLEPLKKASPQVKVKYQVPNAGLFHVF